MGCCVSKPSDLDDSSFNYIPEIHESQSNGTVWDPMTSRCIRLTAFVRSMPGDGDCLFHAIGWWTGSKSADVRSAISHYLKRNADNLEIANLKVSEWLSMECSRSHVGRSRWTSFICRRSPLKQYCRELRKSRWGGQLELLAAAQVYHARVYVWQRASSGALRQMYCFTCKCDKPSCSARLPESASPAAHTASSSPHSGSCDSRLVKAFHLVFEDEHYDVLRFRWEVPER